MRFVRDKPGRSQARISRHISAGCGHELRYANRIFQHCQCGIGLIFIDLRHHKNDALFNVRLTRLSGNIGRCLEKPTSKASKAAAGPTDKS